jgi:hypothetical protein
MWVCASLLLYIDRFAWIFHKRERERESEKLPWIHIGICGQSRQEYEVTKNKDDSSMKMSKHDILLLPNITITDYISLICRGFMWWCICISFKVGKSIFVWHPSHIPFENNEEIQLNFERKFKKDRLSTVFRSLKAFRIVENILLLTKSPEVR